MRKTFALLILLALTVLLGNAAAGTVSHAILLSMDGARPDALQKVGVTWLVEQASYTFRAQTVYPSVTLPAHASMVTGLTPQRHGITYNDWNPSMEPIQVRTLFDFLKGRGLTTAMVVTKGKLRVLARPGTVDHLRILHGNAEAVARDAAALFLQEKPNLLFVHFSDPDSAGHRYGWMSSEYLSAVSRTVAAARALVSTVEASGLSIRTTFFLTADHGGHGGFHGTRSPEDMTIPWIALGPGIRRGHEIQVPVRVYDTAPTILRALGIPVPPSLDGTVISEIFTGP